MSSPGQQQPTSGIRDNRARGFVGDYLKAKIKPAADLSVVSAYFTIFAYAALRTQLESAAKLRFLFGEPRFISSLDPTKTDKKAFQIEDTGLVLANRLQQKAVARECADWIRRKVEIRSIAHHQPTLSPELKSGILALDDCIVLVLFLEYAKRHNLADVISQIEARALLLQPTGEKRDQDRFWLLLYQVFTADQLAACGQTFLGKLKNAGFTFLRP